MVLPTELLASIRKTISPNDKIHVGLIGCNGMGYGDLNSMLQNSEVDVVALCDVDENVLREKTAESAPDPYAQPSPKTSSKDAYARPSAQDHQARHAR